MLITLTRDQDDAKEQQAVVADE